MKDTNDETLGPINIYLEALLATGDVSTQGTIPYLMSKFNMGRKEAHGFLMGYLNAKELS